LSFELKNTLAGLTELVKKSWTIVDDSKTGKKEKNQSDVTYTAML